MLRVATSFMDHQNLLKIILKCIVARSIGVICVREVLFLISAGKPAILSQDLERGCSSVVPDEY
jgi:hypothetical protein